MRMRIIVVKMLMLIINNYPHNHHNHATLHHYHHHYHHHPSLFHHHHHYIYIHTIFFVGTTMYMQGFVSYASGEYRTYGGSKTPECLSLFFIDWVLDTPWKFALACIGSFFLGL